MKQTSYFYYYTKKSYSDSTKDDFNYDVIINRRHFM